MSSPSVSIEGSGGGGVRNGGHTAAAAAARGEGGGVLQRHWRVGVGAAEGAAPEGMAGEFECM